MTQIQRDPRLNTLPSTFPRTAVGNAAPAPLVGSSVSAPAPPQPLVESPQAADGYIATPDTPETLPQSSADIADLPEPTLRTLGRLREGADASSPAGVLVKKERLLNALQRQIGGSFDATRALTVFVQTRELMGKLRTGASSGAASGQPAPTAHLPSQATLADKLGSLSSAAPKVFTSLEAALEAANQNNPGAEAVVEIQGDNGQKAYALVELKNGVTPTQLAEALGTPRGAVYTTNTNGVVQISAPSSESVRARAARALELADVAVADKARGFDLNRTGTQEAERTPAYQANLRTTLKEVTGSRAALTAEKELLDAQLSVLTAAGQGNSGPAQELRGRLGLITTQLGQLQTAESILEARLSQLPPSQDLIPGSERQVGADRGHPERIHARLQSALNLVETRLASATDPAERASLETQRDQLGSELAGVSQRNAQIQQAALKTRVRLGALATISKELDTAKTALQNNIAKLKALEAKLDTLKGTELQEVQSEIGKLRLTISKDRKELVKRLEAEIGVYTEHANNRRSGAKDAISVLELQVAKLKAFDELNPERLLQTIEETQKGLMASMQKAAEKFVGITPDEAKAIGGIAAKTDSYIADYKVAQKKLAGLSEDVARKASLLQNPPASAIGQRSLSALDAAYVKRVQEMLKTAPPGSDLEELAKLYQALAMAENPDIDEDLRARIDVDAARKRIGELSQKPGVQAAFESARKEAVREVFGAQDPAQEVADLLLSPEFKEYLSLLPAEAQKQVLEGEFKKLMALDPAKAAEVQKKMVDQQLEGKAGELIKNATPTERKEAFEQVFGLVNNPNSAADKSSKAADALSAAFDALSPEEMKKVEEYLSLMEKDPSAAEKLYKLLGGKLDNLGSSGAAAKDLLQGVKASGKLGKFMTLVAVVATTGKMPDAFTKGGLKNWADLGSSVLSVAGGLPGLFGLGERAKAGLAAADALIDGGDVVGGLSKLNSASRMAKAVKVMEVLGPIGDILGAGVDAYGSYKDFEVGDTVGGYAKAVGAGAGLTGAGAGILIAAGAAGPGAPVVLAGAAIVGLIAWGIDAGWGESDEESFLRNLGVLLPEPRPKPTPKPDPQEDYENNPGLRYGGREI